MSAITDYYSGTGPDHLGRTHADTLALPLPELEPCHDYIQWWFPLPEASAYFPGAPLLDREDQAAFWGSGTLRESLLASLDRMLEFYGLPSRDDGATRPGQWPRVREWATPGNHNLLRLTRITRSLFLLGCEREAGWLLRQLCAVYNVLGEQIGPVTLTYWAAAAHGSLPSSMDRERMTPERTGD